MKLKAWKILALRYHPDRNKDPKASETFIEVANAYEVLYNEKKVRAQSDFANLSIKSGKVFVGTPNEYSRVEIRYRDDSFYGTLKRSPNNYFSVVFKDGYINDQVISSKWINGKICLIEKDNLLWIKEIERPSNAAVSNTGIIALLHTTYEYGSSSSTPEEFKNLGGTLSIIEKNSDITFTYEFGSNIEGCAISSDGCFASVATLFPDNSIYFFDIKNKGLLWKYKSHIQREPVLGLELAENQLDVFTGHSIATKEKSYAIGLDGVLMPQYQQTLNDLKKLKKQRPQEKVNSLLALASSNNNMGVIEALSQLVSFVKNKGAVPYYEKIVNTLISLLQANNDSARSRLEGRKTNIEKTARSN